MTTSYWLDGQREPLGDAGGRAFGAQVDVAVIGGGVTGCSCALTLAERGLRVRLYEAREVAAGASGRNGGFALRGAAVRYDRARATLGDESARLLWRLTERALARMAALAGDALRPVGSLRLAADADERDDLARELAALREDGFDAAWVEELPPPLDGLFEGALLHPGDGALDPVRWVRRLARRAVEAGAEIAEGRRLEPDELRAAGSETAATVVVAVDGATGAVLPELEQLVVPVRGQMLATEPLPEQLYGRPHYARHGFDYWQQLLDRRLVVGGKRDATFATEQTAADETTNAVQERLDALVVELVGRLPRITHRWAGIWGETPDLLPLAGRLPGRDGVWVAGGYSGHGNVLGFACGDLVARAIAGERPSELALFDPGRAFRI
jgi:glycine/D-amino acid oxidase-like deaminating enzyme